MTSKCTFFDAPKFFLLFPLLLFFIVDTVFAQTTITGKVAGTNGVALSGATITIKGTSNISSTDNTGHFTVSASPGATIIFSFIGYRNHEVVVKNETELNISLTETIVKLDEVVLIGYGSTQRKDVTGSVAKVTPKEFNTGIITNPLQQLQGKVAGLVIVQPGGDPNGDFIVRLRGATSLEGQPPLLVIDGVALDDFNKAVTTLNPADIETYDILKDASAAAIYGSRGANGVILVTTKKSRAGKTLVEYNGFVGMENISNQIDVLSGDQWRRATDTLNLSDLDKGANTDWQKAIAQTGFSQSHLIAISGGTDQFNYRGSVGYISQQGVILNSGKEIITARLTANQKSFKNKLEIRYSINTSVINRDFLPDQNSTSQVIQGGAFAFNQSLHYLSVWPVHNPDGSYYQPPVNVFNPVFLLSELYSKQRENFFQVTAKADYELITGLKLGVFGALSRGNNVYDKFWPAIPAVNVGSEASKFNNNKQNFTGDMHGNYQKNFGKNTIDITGVYEYNQFVNDGFGATARGFQVPALLNNNLATATNITTNDISSYKNEVKLISFLGRAVYTYDGRYIVTASFRRDGSSKFGPNYRWGNFPSVAVAWRASNENFLKNVNWLDNLKLRVSYGYTGNQENLPPNNYQTLYGPAGPYFNNGQVYQSYTSVQENNPDLKWEVRKSFNIGLDFSILNGRINGTFDVFNDNTSDMLFLYDLPQPPFLSATVYANAASALNKGVEITLGTGVVKNKNFTWNIQANMATLKNSITDLLGTFKGADLSLTNRRYGYANGGGFGYTSVTKLEVGYPAGVFWIPQHAGLDKDGHELYNNYDAGGKFIGTSTSYTNQDRVYIDPTPRYTWGVTNNFTYKNFDCSFFLRGVEGQKIFANSILKLENINYLYFGGNVTEKALTNGFTDLPQPSTYWLRDGSFIRLENISVGYQFKNIKGISNLRIYMAATNLFVITSYDGVDPEISTDGSQRYIDDNYYPKTRGFTFGINAAF
jgi:TonB-dependent starch-binding outer membrane protein SusC